MKKISAIWIVLLVFGGISAYEVITRFGWQAVDLPPTQFFWYSLWVAFRNFTTYTLAFLALPFLFGKHARWILVPCAVGMLLIEGAFKLGHLFHADIASVWIDLLRDTNLDETMNFINMFASPLSVTLTVLFFAVIISACICLWCGRYPKLSKSNSVTGACLLLPFLVFNFLLMNWHSGVAQMDYSSFVIASIKAYTDKGGVRRACLDPQLPQKIETEVAVDNLPDVVFVIGESATRNNWSLYGYQRSTTPRMNEICRAGGGICFSDVITTQPDTVNALNLLLTDVTFDNAVDGNWTLAEVYRRAGYRCVLISQQYSGNPRTGLYQLFNGCEKRIDVKVSCDRSLAFDEAVVPLMEHELDTSRVVPTCVFIHLAGMHFPVQNVIPEGEKYFTNEIEPEVLAGLSDYDKDRRNRYDDAIRYEDKVLGMIVDTLAKRQRPNCLFFCSDHGESPRAPIWRDYEDKDVYEIPVLFWFSDSFRKSFPSVVDDVFGVKDNKLQQDELTHGLLELGLIEPWDDVTSQKSFLNPNFKARYPRVMNKGRMKCQRDL